MARKSKPWAVIVITENGARVRTEHTSENKTYEKVRGELAAIKTGNSLVTRIRVEQWEPAYDRWVWYEDIDPKEQP